MTAQEIAGRWDRDGYLVVRDVIPHEVLEPVRAFIRGCVDEQARRELAAGRLGSLYRDLPFGRRYAAMHEELPASAERLFGTPRGRHGREFFQLYTDEMDDGKDTYRLTSRLPKTTQPRHSLMPY